MSTNVPQHLADEPISDLPYAQDGTASRSDLADDVRPIVAVHQRSVDALKGYAKMVEKAEPEFLATAERFRAMHDSHVDRLGTILASLGHQVTDDASMMGNLNQAVVAFRAFIDAIDHDVMTQIRDGEDWILSAFDEAIASRPDEIGAQLREMRAEIDVLLAETAHLG